MPSYIDDTDSGFQNLHNIGKAEEYPHPLRMEVKAHLFIAQVSDQLLDFQIAHWFVRVPVFQSQEGDLIFSVVDDADLLSIHQMLCLSPSASFIFALSMLFSGQSVLSVLAGQIVSDKFIK